MSAGTGAAVGFNGLASFAACGAMAAVLLCIGTARGRGFAVNVVTVVWRRRRVVRGWVPVRLWLAWWQCRQVAVPRRGEPPLTVAEWARFTSVMLAWPDKGMERLATEAERAHWGLIARTGADGDG